MRSTTATGFHPPHFDTVYRSDDGGKNWRPTYYMDPRFKECNVGPDYVTASTGKSWKGGETPFGVAICNRDPERVLLVRNEAHITHNGGKHWFCGSAAPATNPKPGPGAAWICNGLVVTTTWHYYIDPFEAHRQPAGRGTPRWHARSPRSLPSGTRSASPSAYPGRARCRFSRRFPGTSRRATAWRKARPLTLRLRGESIRLLPPDAGGQAPNVAAT